MKKIIAFIIPALIFSAASAEKARISVESITPSTAVLFLKTAKLERIIKSANRAFNRFSTEEQKKDYMAGIDEFKKKTGIDPMDTGSLGRAGVDVTREAGLAFLSEKNGNNKHAGNNERVIVYIPVQDEKTAPLKFIKIIKKSNSDKKDMDVYPVITKYGSHRIYQVRKDVFSTAMNGYFILAPYGDLIKEVIDTVSDQGQSLADDEFFMNYTSKVKVDHDYNFFMKKEFLSGLIGEGKSRNSRPSRGKTSDTFNRYERTEVSGRRLAMEPPEKPGQMKKESPLDVIDYVCAGMSLEDNRVILSLSSSFNNSNPMVGLALSLLRTGLTERAIYFSEASAYSFFSLDLSAFEKNCSASAAAPGCKEYAEFRKKIKEETGIDFSRDFLPYYSGVVNVIAGNKSGYGGMVNYVVYLPMNNRARSLAVWKKSRSAFSKRYKNSGMFGSMKIRGQSAYWFSDQKKNKNIVLTDSRGIYIGNDQSLIKKIMAAGEFSAAVRETAVGEKMGESVFFLTYTKEGSFINSLLMMQAKQRKDISGAVDQIGDVYITGKKNGMLLTIDIDVGIRQVKADGK